MDVEKKPGWFSSGKSVISPVKSGHLDFRLSGVSPFRPLGIRAPPKGEVEFDGFWSVGHINLKVFRRIPQSITCGSFPGHLAEVWGGKISRIIGCRKYIPVNFIYLVLKDFFR